MKRKVLRYLRDKALPPFKPSHLGKAIIECMHERPDEWVIEKHTVNHAPSGIQIWISNDVNSREIYRVPEGVDKEVANKSLSHGDRLAIEEMVKRLRLRIPSSSLTSVGTLVELLQLTTATPPVKP